MRTTLQIDDHLLQDLREHARREGISLGKLVNRVLQSGLAAMQQPSGQPPAYREKMCRMGKPRVPLDKALAIAAEIEDEETLKTLSRGETQ